MTEESKAVTAVAGLTSDFLKLVEPWRRAKEIELASVATAAATEREAQAEARALETRTSALIESQNRLFASGLRRLRGEVLSEQENIERVIEVAASIVGDTTPIKPPDSDRLTAIFQAARHFSAEEARQIWARVLAREFLKPGEVSLRTIEFIRALSSEDAKIIAEHRVQVASTIDGTMFYFTAQPLFGSDGGASMSGLPTYDVEELGLMRVSDKTEQMPVYFLHNGRFCFRAKQANIQMDIRGYLTRLGSEVFSILHDPANISRDAEQLRVATNDALVPAVVIVERLDEADEVWVTGESAGRTLGAWQETVDYAELRAQETGFCRYVLRSGGTWGSEIPPVASFRS